MYSTTNRTFLKILFVITLIPVILLTEFIRYFHGVQFHPPPPGYFLKTLTTSDDKKIALTYSGNNHNRALLLIHGYLGSTYNQICSNLEFFNQLDMDIIALDLRNHGNSQLSLPISGGYYERLDVLAAIEWINKSWDDYVILASSMGVYSTVFALQDLNQSSDLTEYELPTKIILESFGVDVKIGVINLFTTYIYFPQVLSTILAIYMELRFPELFKRDVVEALTSINVPALIAHGKREQIYPPAIIHPIIRKSRLHATTYVIIPRVEHSKLWPNDFYQQQFLNFLRSY